jgi:K+-sensing histidine kinase KdpD
VRRQARLVEDLLDMGRMLSGKLELQRTPLRVEDTIRGVAEMLQNEADAKRIHLTVEVAHPIPPLNADDMRLQQIFWNLISNAIKFTPEDRVVIVRLRQVHEFIEVVITDSGEGIPRERLGVIFSGSWHHSENRDLDRGQRSEPIPLSCFEGGAKPHGKFSEPAAPGHTVQPMALVTAVQAAPAHPRYRLAIAH